MDSLIVFTAKYVFILVALGIVFAWLRAKNDAKLEFALAAIAAAIIAVVISRIAAKLYFDPRPFVSEHVKPLISHAADNGFPSDHALLTMTLTAVTYFYSKKIAGAMLVLTILVGVARILAKVHSPLDIGAGWVIGIIGAFAGYYFAVLILNHYHKSPQVTDNKF